MGNDQRSNSRTILDQVFWAGVTPPSQTGVQPAAKDAPNEPATVLLPQASSPPVSPQRVLDTNNGIQPGQIAGGDVSPAAISAAVDRHELKADASEPEPAQEIPSISSPAVQPTLIEHADVAHQQFRMMLQTEAAGADAPLAHSSAAADAGTGERESVRVELQDVLKSASLDDKKRGEIDALMETLRCNLDKIEQHGKRADALLKRMQMHSREALVNIGPPAPMPLPDESLTYPEEVRRSA